MVRRLLVPLAGSIMLALKQLPGRLRQSRRGHGDLDQPRNREAAPSACGQQALPDFARGILAQTIVREMGEGRFQLEVVNLSDVGFIDGFTWLPPDTTVRDRDGKQRRPLSSHRPGDRVFHRRYSTSIMYLQGRRGQRDGRLHCDLESTAQWNPVETADLRIDDRFRHACPLRDPGIGDGECRAVASTLWSGASRYRRCVLRQAGLEGSRWRAPRWIECTTLRMS